MSRYVGMDLGIGTRHRVAVLDGSERRGKPFAIEVSREGFEELLRRATEGAEGPVKIVMEPTGLAWVPVAAYMSAAGHQVHLVKPQKVGHLRKFLKQHTKSDSIDAETNARLPQVDPDGVHELRLPTPEQMTLRRLVNRRERLAQEVADQKRRVHALMVMVNPPLMSALGESAFSQAARALYRKHADPETVVKMGRDKLKKFWKKHGPVDENLTERVFQACSTTTELYRQLRQNQQLPFDYVEVQEELQAELDWMEHAQTEVQRLEQHIATLYDRLDPDHTLEQIRGIGAIIAASIEAIVIHISSFHNGRQFTSYSGLCPRKKQSGGSDPALPITKCGQRLLKKYFYLAAGVARQWDPEFAAYYARRYARGDHHNRIMIALARKMALRVYSLLKRRERARQASSPQRVPVSFVLRDPETGAIVDKKQARLLVLEKYTRQVANPDRHKRDTARRGKSEAGTGLAKKEWPSKDATSKHAAPSASIPHPANRDNSGTISLRGGPPRAGGWMSAGDVLKALLENMAVENPVDALRKTCENSSARPAKFPQKRT
jgi:transposase